MIQKILKVIFCIAIGLLLSFAFVQIVAKGLDCQEEYECHKWADWAKEYPLFYFTQWQADQCKAHGIEVNAPVHEQAKPEAKAEVKEIMTATVYSYSSDENQTDGNPNRMASNKDVCPGVIACPSRYPFGTKVEIKEQVYTCEDRMATKYRAGNFFDIWQANHVTAVEWGVQQLTVKILK